MTRGLTVADGNDEHVSTYHEWPITRHGKTSVDFMSALHNF
ncbi:MAG TPA: hypothetical protein VN812_12590 [Candidatus Acidoferrales bacterium]|nr:hypothetical protein [Candidatus Acidoferrales bacterium]